MTPPANNASPLNVAEEYASPTDPNDPSVLTFVVGLDGVAKMNAIARKGGTREAFLIDGGDVVEQVFYAMSSISTESLPCEFPLPEFKNPYLEVLDPHTGGVWHTPPTSSEVQLMHISDAASCEPDGGWYFDRQVTPTKIVLCRSTCSNVHVGTIEVGIACRDIPARQ